MKKFFLIPLMTLVCSVMAWAADVHVSSFSELKSAVEKGSATTIYLDQDIEYREAGANKGVNITRSLTIDGQGYSLTGYAGRNNTTNGTFISLNHDSEANTYSIDVTIKNLTINEEKFRAIETRSNVGSLTLENCTIKVTGTGGYQQPLTIGGNQSSAAEINIINSHIECSKYYPIISFNPMNLTMTNSSTKGWCAVYFKGIDGSAGSNGSTMVATNCVFDAQNYNSGQTNSFGAFVLEDDGIDVTLDNCQINCVAHDPKGIAKQTAFCLSSWKEILSTRQGYGMHLDPCEFIIKGASTEIVGNLLSNRWTGTIAECPVTFTVYGGTFDEDLTGKFDVATGYHVNVLPTVKDGEDITLYRVVKDAEEKEPGVLYDLNDNVEGEGNGENPITSFDLSTGTDMTLNQETTTAGYVQVSDKDNGVDPSTPTTVTVGTSTEDQTLIINEGLDVQGESQVIVQAGSTLQIGEGGITTSAPENIVVEANENGAASLLLDPEVIVNNTPNLTVRMTAKQIGRNAQGDFYWHRFAMPVAATITSWDKEGTLVAADPEYTVQYPTYIYGWNYDENKWKNLSGVSAMVPLQGYTITLASDYIHVDGNGKVVSEGTSGGNLNELQDVVYTFKGNLVGNTDQALNFQAEGFNFFGNSYTGYMDVLKLIEGLQSNNVEGTVYMWCNDPDDEDGNYQSYVGVPLYKLSNPTQRARLATWQQEVAPMQTFILRLRGADSADESISYASAIWGNPRYGNNSGSGSGAPRRRVASINEDTYMEIAVKAANGKGSRVDFTESANNSDDFESGYDVVKYMNENSINLYATINGEDFSSVVTNNIVGKTLSLKTNGEIVYTMSFKNVEGEEYAIRDNATGAIIAIEEGATYEFAAQPNSTIEGRFEIVSRADAPTAIENTEVKANVKGIYTILGQYLGENFDILPAGVYVVDGVKIVK